MPNAARPAHRAYAREFKQQVIRGKRSGKDVLTS